VNKRTIESLVLAGAFDFQEDIGRHHYFANLPGTEVNFLETLIKYGNKVQSEKNNKQITLFGEMAGFEIPKPEAPVVTEWSSSYQLNKEKELIGIYLSAHPLDEYKIELNHFCSHSLAELSNLENLENLSISFGGKVTSAVEKMTKNGFPFGTMELEDFTDSYKLSLFQKDYIKFKSFFTEGLSLFIRGRVQKRTYSNSEELELKVDSMELLNDLKTKVKDFTVQLPLEVISRDFSERLMEWLKQHQGKTNIQFKIVDEEDQISLSMFSRRYRIEISQEFMRFFEEEDLMDFRLN
jgi:DNA polymerase III subunit alpha